MTIHCSIPMLARATSCCLHNFQIDKWTSSLIQFIHNIIVSFFFFPTKFTQVTYCFNHYWTFGHSAVFHTHSSCCMRLLVLQMMSFLDQSGGGTRGDSSHCSSAIKFKERKPIATGNSPSALHDYDIY